VKTTGDYATGDFRQYPSDRIISVGVLRTGLAKIAGRSVAYRRLFSLSILKTLKSFYPVNPDKSLYLISRTPPYET
jgi:hypothetical protein